MVWIVTVSGLFCEHNACLEEQGLKSLPLSLEGQLVKSEIPTVQVGAPLAAPRLPPPVFMSRMSNQKFRPSR